MTTIAFDLIGVLAEPSWRELAGAPDLARWRRLRVGQIAEPEFWGDADAAAYRACLDLRPGRLAMLTRLRARGHRLLLASNFAAAWVPALRARLPDPALFERWLISGELGVAKPDPAFWRILRALDPELLLVDDQAENLAAARSAGLRALSALPGADLESRLHAALG